MHARGTVPTVLQGLKFGCPLLYLFLGYIVLSKLMLIILGSMFSCALFDAILVLEGISSGEGTHTLPYVGAVYSCLSAA